jgi:hypothetical protein
MSEPTPEQLAVLGLNAAVWARTPGGFEVGPLVTALLSAYEARGARIAELEASLRGLVDGVCDCKPSSGCKRAEARMLLERKP